MGLFGNGGGLFKSEFPIGPGEIFEPSSKSRSNPGIGEKIEMLFTDVETEGKKRGYDRASREYAEAYRKIEKEFSETMNLIENQKNTYGRQAYQFIEHLEELEKEREYLKNLINSKVKDVSKKYHISESKIMDSVSSGTLLYDGPGRIGLLDIIYSYKEKKLREAEQRGYAEAKELYESKIQNLKDELKRLKEKGDSEIRTLLHQISQILDAIAEEEMKIAELKILL